MAEIQVEIRADKIWRKKSDGTWVEKGSGIDGDFRYSNVEMMHPTDGSAPFVVIRKGLKPTVVATVNRMMAISHTIREEIVFLTLRNHVGWTKGITSMYRIDFMDSFDSSLFLQTYNALSTSLTAIENDETEANETALVALLETFNVEDEDNTKEEDDENGLDNEQRDDEESQEDAGEESQEDAGEEDEGEDADNGDDDDSEDDEYFPNSQADCPDREFSF